MALFCIATLLNKNGFEQNGCKPEKQTRKPLSLNSRTISTHKIHVLYYATIQASKIQPNFATMRAVQTVGFLAFNNTKIIMCWEFSQTAKF